MSLPFPLTTAAPLPRFLLREPPKPRASRRNPATVKYLPLKKVSRLEAQVRLTEMGRQGGR